MGVVGTGPPRAGAGAGAGSGPETRRLPVHHPTWAAATYKKINCGCSVIWGCIGQPIENVVVPVSHWVLHGTTYSKFNFDPAATYTKLNLCLLAIGHCIGQPIED